MTQAADLYQVLMVDRAVDGDILEAVYRRLVARYEPGAGSPSGAPSDRPGPCGTPSGRQPGCPGPRFGRYAGWNLRQLAAHDPDYLEWLVRSLGGRQYRAQITAILGTR